MRTQKKGSLRLAAAPSATGALSAIAGALDAILLSAGINKIIRVTIDFGLPLWIRETVQIEKLRGAPPTGKRTLIGVRIQPDGLATLESWIMDDGRGLIRRLVETPFQVMRREILHVRPEPPNWPPRL